MRPPDWVAARASVIGNALISRLILRMSKPVQKYLSRCCKQSLLLLAGMGICWTMYGQQLLEVPVDVQVPLFLKATSYDRAFASKLHHDGVLQVGICYQARNRTSQQEMESLRSELSKPIPGFAVELILMPIDEGTDFSRRKEWSTLSAIYITSLRGFDLDHLLEQARIHQVMSVCTHPGLAAKGVSMGFELVGSRPRFVINRSSATSEGCDFSSQLLKLATIY